MDYQEKVFCRQGAEYLVHDPNEPYKFQDMKFTEDKEKEDERNGEQVVLTRGGTGG